MKRVGKEEHLLTDNEVIVNDKKNNTEVIDNILIQKPNSQLGIGKYWVSHLSLHIYNTGTPKYRFHCKCKSLDKNPKRRASIGKLNFLSKKQLDIDI